MSEHVQSARQPSHLPSSKTPPAPASPETSPLALNLLRDAIQHPTPRTLTPSAVASLQRQYGNRFVQRLIAQAQQPMRRPACVPMIRVAAAPSAVQRLSEQGVKDHLFMIDLPEGAAEAISRLTTNWERSGRRYPDRVLHVQELMDTLNMEIITQVRPAPDSAQAWERLLEQMLPNELPSEKEAREEEAMEQLSSSSGENPNKQEKPEMDPFSVEVYKVVEELQIPLKVPPMPFYDQQRQIERNQQKVQMIARALAYAAQMDELIEVTITQSEFVRDLLSWAISQQMVTFNDVINEIAVKLPIENSSVQADTMDNRLRKIMQSSDTPLDKLVTIARFLWGSFEWHVNKGDSPELKDPEQMDAFILWLTDPTEKAPEPSGSAMMNCWEGVIFTLYKAGYVSKQKLQGLYKEHNKDTAGVGVAYKLLYSPDQTIMYADKKFNGKHPQVGDIVSIWIGGINEEQPHHVVLMLGQTSAGNDRVLSLWSGATGGMLGMTTIQDLVNPTYTVYISFNTPDLTL